MERLFYLVIEEGLTSTAAALDTGINIRRAQHYVKKYNDDEERRLPFNVKKTACGRQPKFAEIGFIDEHPTAVLDDIRQALCRQFPGLTISISSLHRYFGANV